MRKTLIFVMVLAALMLLPLVALAQGGSSYTVQADDTLGKIAEKQYGDPLAYTAIAYYSNQKATEDDSLTIIEDPNIVEPGWVIYLPTAEEANAFLIGNIEGGAFNESPLLAEMVAAGELPLAMHLVEQARSVPRGPPRQRRHDPNLLQDLRPFGPAARLGLLSARGGRGAEPYSRAFQRQPGSSGCRLRGPGRPGAPGPFACA